MQLEGRQGPWPVCMGRLVILTLFLGGKATTSCSYRRLWAGWVRVRVRVRGVCRKCREGIRCCSSWNLLPVFLSPLTIKVLTGRNGWRPKQGALEGGSSRHSFSSVLFKEILTLDCPCSR